MKIRRANRNARPATLLAIAALFAAIAPPAFAQDAERGHQLAERWCSSCHAVDEKAVGKTPAPAFIGIASRHADDRRWLRVWLMAPHPSMPDMNLSRMEIDDVVAYLASLQPRKTN